MKLTSLLLFASDGFLSITGLTLGNVDCLTGNVGLDIYIFQLLPDGTRMSFCGVANQAPDNFVYKFPIGIGPASDCSNTAFPLPDQVFYDHNNGGVDSGMYLCEGGVYEVVVVVYVNDTGAAIPSEQSVNSILNPNQYEELNLGTFFVNYTNEFATPNPFPIPNSTAAITGPNGETGTMTTSCNEDVTLFIEALSYIGRCRVEREPIPNYYPFCDFLDPNMTNGTYSPSIESELENFLSYTVNGGSPVIIRDGNSGNASTEAYGGQQTGPGNLPGLGAEECYTGLCGARPFPIPDSMCAGDVMVVTLETFDVYTNTTVSDQMTITFTGEGCNDCGPTCPTSANITTSVTEACGGDMITITGNTIGEGNGFVTSVDGECSTSVTVDVDCGTNININPNESQIADAGTSGTHTYTISWDGGGPNCISDFDVTANYDCPPNIVCPTSANITASVNEACGSDMITITGNTIGEGTANFTITESTGVTSVWILFHIQTIFLHL